MALAKRSVVFAGLAVSAAIFGTPAQAAPMVTYTWTTTSEGFGPHVSAPSSATFEAPLSDVLAGVIPQSDISNIELTYPGLSFDSAVTSSIGFDFAAFVKMMEAMLEVWKRERRVCLKTCLVLCDFGP